MPGADAIEWISKAFNDDSALLKHELAYCLGQMQDPRAIPTLSAVLRDTEQEPMVRHEAGESVKTVQSRSCCCNRLFVTVNVYPSVGEALGAIGDPAVLDLLEDYSQDPVVEVQTVQTGRSSKTLK